MARRRIPLLGAGGESRQRCVAWTGSSSAVVARGGEAARKAARKAAEGTEMRWRQRRKSMSRALRRQQRRRRSRVTEDATWSQRRSQSKALLPRPASARVRLPSGGLRAPTRRPPPGVRSRPRRGRRSRRRRDPERRWTRSLLPPRSWTPWPWTARERLGRTTMPSARREVASTWIQSRCRLWRQQGRRKGRLGASAASLSFPSSAVAPV
mmetsp:Transcript_130686/g.279443  ORF Transcript_130686/g.279443 Transcript_130686/m.279443 type:complete len:210 (+) Transcript_130686:782-1411(+)